MHTRRFRWLVARNEDSWRGKPRKEARDDERSRERDSWKKIKTEQAREKDVYKRRGLGSIFGPEALYESFKLC